MDKKNKTLFGIFTESVGLYVSNISKFLKYMTFPVLGQILGLVIILGTTYFYTSNIENFLVRFPNFNNFNALLLISLLITLPGLSIFCKAFWEYLIAYSAVNSMYENMQKSGRVYDFDAHTELIKRRTASFIGLWLLLGIIFLFAICPFFMIICAIFGIYFILAFQVFTFEPELSPIGCLRKSLVLIKGHFVQTFLLMTFVGLLTYVLIPQLANKLFEIANINLVLSKAILPFVSLFPEVDLTAIGFGVIKHSDIAIITIQAIVAQILIQYTLPLRSILWAIWYKELNNGISNTELNKQKRKISKKRPSEKLMAATRKKYSQKKLDENIIKRATEKDDDEY